LVDAVGMGWDRGPDEAANDDLVFSSKISLYMLNANSKIL
jgi:hypothetical protein